MKASLTFLSSMPNAQQVAPAPPTALQKHWRAHEALESSELRHWHALLHQAGPDQASPLHTARPRLQAVFCMDVRSEAFRRALEAVDTRVATVGFAGAFGLSHDQAHRELEDDEAVALASRALQGMSLTQGFAPFVLLVAHGARSAAHAHLACLQCGACQGRPGQAHATRLAEVLNRASVRQALALRGLTISADTRFAAALHDTDTDQLQLLDQACLPPEIRAWLAQAERDAPLLRGHRRPDWGLAGNAALIIAPRERTRHLDLQGRAFLHDYRAEHDVDGALLSSILNSALPIAQGINQAYNEAALAQLHGLPASSIAKDLLGNLPALRMQNGQTRVHAPQRLAVWIDAPAARIAQCLARHPSPRQLVEERKVYLFRLDAPQGVPCGATA